MAHAAAVIPATANEMGSAPILVDTQHEDLVHDAQLDYYGCKLATCSSGTKRVVVVVVVIVIVIDISMFECDYF
jgi:hypothetical protein